MHVHIYTLHTHVDHLGHIAIMKLKMISAYKVPCSGLNEYVCMSKPLTVVWDVDEASAGGHAESLTQQSINGWHTPCSAVQHKGPACRPTSAIHATNKASLAPQSDEHTHEPA